MENQVFDNEAHERAVAERYRRLAMYDAFNTFVDLALDGTITLEQALTAFMDEYHMEFETAPEGAA